ncbi:tyrosine-type recombinase/integrase [Bradyrhizobium retamae]|uniref:tyrosine-type recombinase/integrase n=1 Tax=Bradyrhizobium retamae TaxID=1300035 RepID=UPI0032220849
MSGWQRSSPSSASSNTGSRRPWSMSAASWRSRSRKRIGVWSLIFCGRSCKRCSTLRIPPRAKASATGPCCIWRFVRVCVSELTGLKLEDIDLSSMSIRVLGKGRRERALPLWKTTAAALRAWLAVRGRVAAPEVFVNARGEPLSRWGFAYLLKQHAATAARAHPGLVKKRISPHVLRYMRNDHPASNTGHP